MTQTTATVRVTATLTLPQGEVRSRERRITELCEACADRYLAALPDDAENVERETIEKGWPCWGYRGECGNSADALTPHRTLTVLAHEAAAVLNALPDEERQAEYEHLLDVMAAEMELGQANLRDSSATLALVRRQVLRVVQ